ncbi:NDP-sugar synthase [Candidatus Thorarchaeota archaeon]|nr:MAG: NDP-sugar synthase [Candidatus Thorarchaeota archaeon]
MAAGKGERLKGLTQTIPKALVQVAGKTLLEHGIERLTKANVQNITIAVGWKSDMIRDAIPQFENSSNIQIVDVYNYEIGPLQTLTTALNAIHDEDSIICPVDLLISSDAISKIVSHHAGHPNALVTLAVDHHATSGSIVSINSLGRIIGVQKEVDHAESISKSAMFMVTSSRFAEYCKNGLDKGSTTVVSALNDIIENGFHVQSYSVQEKWFDVDTIADTLEANRHLLENAIVHSSGTIFIPSGDTMDFGNLLHLGSGIEVGAGVSLKGPSLLLRDSKIGANCTIGPYTSVGIGTQIGDRCEIQNAVISGQSRITDNTKLNDILMNESKIFSMEE